MIVNICVGASVLWSLKEQSFSGLPLTGRLHLTVRSTDTKYQKRMLDVKPLLL